MSGASVPANGRYLHRQFFENHLEYDGRRPWIFGRGQWAAHPTMLACNFYPQPAGRWCLEDFARMLAHGTPELVCWMWCDGTAPFGHEEPLREFAAVLRRLPMGPYETRSAAGGVYVRRHRDGRVVYAVNTTRQPAVAHVPVAGREAVDSTSGKTYPAEAGRATVQLQPVEIRAFEVR